MKVAIDISTAVTQQAGVARYTRELYAALARLGEAPELCPVVFAPSIVYPLAQSSSPCLMPGSVRGWRLRFALRHLARRPLAGPWDHSDVYHATDMVFPPLRRVPVVMTVHDLTFITHARFHTRMNGSYLRLAVPRMARSATLIVADSHSTRKDVIERLKVPEDRVFVVYPGLSRAFAVQPSDEQVALCRSMYGLPDNYILSVGTLEPRKNVLGAIAAYRLLRSRRDDAPPLVLVGATGWHESQLGLVDGDALEGVIRLGYLGDNDLLGLYRGCSAFLYPSFYEGFGFPVLEALAQGAPVVTSRVSSLPEVTGEAAVLVDPASTEEIAQALELVLYDTATSSRLRLDGPRRAGLYRYDRCAQATLALYSLAAAG